MRCSNRNWVWLLWSFSLPQWWQELSSGLWPHWIGIGLFSLEKPELSFSVDLPWFSLTEKDMLSVQLWCLIGCADCTCSAPLRQSCPYYYIAFLFMACTSVVHVLAPVVSRTRAENQMETCGVHLDGTLFLPAQGRTPRVPVKAAKGSRDYHSRSKQTNYKSGSCDYLCIALGSGGSVTRFKIFLWNPVSCG